MTSTALKVAGLIEGGRNYTQDGKKNIPTEGKSPAKYQIFTRRHRHFPFFTRARVISTKPL